jgi:hypothetical protein
LQGKLDIEVATLKKQVINIDSNGSAAARKEILKGMINLLVEQL